MTTELHLKLRLPKDIRAEDVDYHIGADIDFALSVAQLVMQQGRGGRIKLIVAGKTNDFHSPEQLKELYRAHKSIELVVVTA